jgi:hypothetical protein
LTSLNQKIILQRQQNNPKKNGLVPITLTQDQEDDQGI